MYSRSVQTFTAATIPLLVRNTGEEDVPAYAIAAIGEEANLNPGIFSRSGTGVGQGSFEIPIRKPDATAIESGSFSQFLITLDDPIPAGELGRATFSLPAWVKVSSAINLRAASVAPQAGSWELGEGEGYYHIVDIKTVEGVKYALVQAAASDGSVSGFKITTTMVSRAGVCSIYHIDDVDYATAIDTEKPIKSSAIFGDLPLDTIGQCVFRNGVWVVTQASCG